MKMDCSFWEAVGEGADVSEGLSLGWHVGCVDFLGVGRGFRRIGEGSVVVGSMGQQCHLFARVFAS